MSGSTQSPVLLKHFSKPVKGKRQRLHAFDKAAGRAYATTPDDATVRNTFYNFDNHPQRFSLEPLLGIYEHDAAPVIAGLLEHKDIRRLTEVPFLLTDTVGFIRKLPTDLVDSFKSTLDEVREADLLIHVVDISHPDFEEQISVVDKTIADLGAGGKPTMIVFNKIDAYTYIEKAEDDLTPKTRENITLEELMKTWMAKLNDNCIFISAREKINMDELKTIIYNKVRELHVQKYPYNDFLYQTYDEE